MPLPDFVPPPPRASRADRLRNFHEQLNDWGRRKSASVLLLVFTAGVPALELTGFGFLPRLEMSTWLAISAAGGALAGAIFYSDPKYWFVGVIPGALAGVSILVGTYAYTQGRQQVSNVELVLVNILAALPAAGLYYLVMRTLVLRDAPPDPE